MIDPQSLDIFALPWLPLGVRAAFPQKPAVYLAIDAQAQVQYVGVAVNARNRWIAHHRLVQLEALEGQVRIAFLFLDDESLLAKTEKALIDWFKPPLNQSKVSKDEIREGEPQTEIVYICLKKTEFKKLDWLVNVFETSASRLFGQFIEKEFDDIPRRVKNGELDL